MAGQAHNGHLFALLKLANLLGHGLSIHDWHLKVCEHNLDPLVSALVELEAL